MRKVTKILLKVLSVTLLFLIFCPIVLTLVVELPSVQNYIVDRVTAIISKKLDTRVSIDHIRLGALGSVRFEGFYIEDYQQDTLLYVGRAKVFLSRFDGANGITLRNGSIGDAYLNIRETPEGGMNISQVVKRLSKKDKEKKGDFSLKVDDVFLQNINLVIEQHDHRHPGYGIDYNDMHIEHITALVDDFVLDGSRVGGYIRNLSAVEHCGFMVQNFTGHFLVDKGVIDLRDFEVMATHSDVRIKSLVLRGEDWTSYKDFIHNVRMEGELYKSTVSSSDIAHFAPKLLPWNLMVRDASATVKGTVADMLVTVNQLKFGKSSSLHGDVRLRGLPDVRRGVMNLNLKRLTTTEEDIAWMLGGITGRQLPDKVLSISDAAGEIICAGHFDGGFREFNAEALLTTEAGNATLMAESRPMERVEGEPERSALVAQADLRHLQLGRLLQVPSLGYVTGNVTFNGNTSKQSGLYGRLRGDVAQIEFNKCNYEDINVNGIVANKSFTGEVSSAGRPINFKLKGSADLNYQSPVYDFELNVADADLHAMNVNKRDSVSRVGFNASLYAVGRTLDDMNGSLTIDKGRYYYNADTLSSGPVKLIARNTDNRRSLELTSDFADANFTGPTSYTEIIGYLKTAMSKYLPGLQFNSAYESAGEDDGYSALSATVKNIDPLLNAISEGLQLAPNSKINFMMNPASNHLTLRAESDYLERGKMLVTNLNVNVTNQGDSLAMYLRSEDLYSGMLHLPQLSVMGGAKNDRVLLSAAFDDKVDSLSGAMALMAQLRRVEPTGMPRVDVTLYPATINVARKQWRITSDQISIDTTRIEVNNFMVANDRQQLHLSGVASRSREDSLTVRMRDFELGPFTGFAMKMGYDVEALGNGVASMKGGFKRGEITADINIDSLRVNDYPVAPLHINSRWDLERQRVRVNLVNGRTGRNIVQGYYSPTSKRYFAEGMLNNIPMLMLDPMLKSVVSGTEGRADARLQLTGEGRMAKLNGSVDVANLSTMIDFTHVRYTVPRATVKVENNHFRASNVRVYDAENNSGLLSMDLSLEHLSNIAYDIRIAPRNMIALNTTAQQNDLFYGKVYASGTATVTGSKKGTILDIVGTTEGDSHFYMPLSGKSDAASADFVVFEQPGVEIDSTNYLVRKKMAFERKTRRTESSSSNMSINIELTATPSTEVQLVIDPTVGDIIKGRGNGTLNMRIVPSANIFDMYGDYTITEGSYLFTLQNIINKLFVINSGSTIQWTGDPLDARLNIDAVYKLKASLQPLLSSTTLDNVTRAVPVECIINLTERLTAPTVTFDIKVPNADSEIQNAVSNLLNNQQSIATQFMYLLVSGSFYSDASTSSSIGATASATTGFELLSNQLSNWLSSDDYNIILRYRPKSELTSDEIDFGFSKSLVNDRLLVELEGNYLVDNKMAQSSNMSNFMGEAYITWLIDRAGALKLRGFTQTIDRFDENQGLQETGVGIYYKEDFNNWTDLKRRIKERFMSRRRREQMQAEERTAEERVIREADSLERSGENEYLYNRIRRDSVANISDRIRRDSATTAARVDSVAWRRVVRERIDSLRRANSLRREQE